MLGTLVHQCSAVFQSLFKGHEAVIIPTLHNKIDFAKIKRLSEFSVTMKIRRVAKLQAHLELNVPIF